MVPKDGLNLYMAGVEGWVLREIEFSVIQRNISVTSAVKRCLYSCKRIYFNVTGHLILQDKLRCETTPLPPGGDSAIQKWRAGLLPDIMHHDTGDPQGRTCTVGSTATV